MEYNRGMEMSFKIATAVLVILYSILRRIYEYQYQGVPHASATQSLRQKVLYGLVTFAWVPIAAYLATPWLDVFAFPLPAWIRIIGEILLLASMLLFYVCHRELGRNWSPKLEISEDHRLITSGPYQSVRHPMYTSFFLFGLGLLLATANLMVGGFYLVAMFTLYVERVDEEEALMIEQFGDAYREYMQRTGRLLPRR